MTSWRDTSWTRLHDREEARANVSAQWHLAASEQALQAARAGCDVRAERYTQPLFDRPVAERRGAPFSYPGRVPLTPLSPHPITELRDRIEVDDMPIDVAFFDTRPNPDTQSMLRAAALQAVRTQLNASDAAIDLGKLKQAI